MPVERNDIEEITRFLETGFEYGELIQLGYDCAIVENAMKSIILKNLNGEKTRRGGMASQVKKDLP
jgi:hypothetical protein